MKILIIARNYTLNILEYLGPHNDNAYFNDAAGLLVLHCLEHNGTGGENFVVDGFQIADKIKRENPKIFDRLSKTIVGFEYIEEGHHFKNESPILNVDPLTGDVVKFRYYTDDRTPLHSVSPGDIRDFYKALKVLVTELLKDDNQFTFKLHPGTVVFVDNWRLLHGRHAYTGNRSMAGCYVSRDEYQSALRVNGIIE
jgi:alpha-ketoglutarate-dependent taurine dioxygenase